MVSSVKPQQQHPFHKRLGDIVLFVGTDKELEKAKKIIKNTYKVNWVYYRLCDMATEMNHEDAYSTHEERKKANQGATIQELPVTKVPGTKVYKIYMGDNAVILGRLSALADLPYYVLRATVLKPLPIVLKRFLHAGISAVVTLASHGLGLLAHVPEILSYLFNQKTPFWKIPLLGNPFYKPRNLEDFEKGPYEVVPPLLASLSPELKEKILWRLKIKAEREASEKTSPPPSPHTIDPKGAIEVTIIPDEPDLSTEPLKELPPEA